MNQAIPVGVGFLINENHVFTCAHVILDSLGIPRDVSEIPMREVIFDYPSIETATVVRAGIVYWDHNADIALLELESNLPAASRFINISVIKELSDHKAWVYGTPYGDDDGNWVQAVIMGPTAAGHYHFESRSGYRPELGFSGGPVWDEDLNAVVGMVVAVDEGRPTAAAGRMIHATKLNSVLDALKIPVPTSLGAFLVPHSREAEEAVLGAVLIDSPIFFDVSQFVETEDFYIFRHRWIWEAFNSIHMSHMPIVLLTVRGELDKQGNLIDVGGVSYLESLIENCPNLNHAVTYGKIVKETALRRRMLAAANKIAKLAYEEDRDIHQVLDEAEYAIRDVSINAVMQTNIREIKQVYVEFYENFKRVITEKYEQAFISGFPDIDYLLAGMRAESLILVAGLLGSGTTSFLLSVANNSVRNSKRHVAFFSLEWATEDLIQRMIAQVTGIDLQRIRTRNINDSEMKLLSDANEVFKNADLFFDDTPGLSIIKLKIICHKLHSEHKLDFIIVDYLQLMRGYGAENGIEELSHIAYNLKVLARELGIPVLVVVQLSQDLSKRSDFNLPCHNSEIHAAIVANADIVMILNHSELMIENGDDLQTIDIVKNRNGPIGKVDLVFHNNIMAFGNKYCE